MILVIACLNDVNWTYITMYKIFSCCQILALNADMFRCNVVKNVSCHLFEDVYIFVIMTFIVYHLVA